MRDAHRALGLVDVLAAGAAGAVHVDAQVAFVDLDVDVAGFRHHGDGRGRGVDAAGGFGRGDTLHAVDAGFILQLGEDARSVHADDDFLVAAEVGFALAHHFELPALELRVALVHAKEVACEERRLVSAGARTDFKQGAAVVGRVLREHENGEFALDVRQAAPDFDKLVTSHRAQFGVGRQVRGHGG